MTDNHDEIRAFLESVPWKLLSEAYNRRRNLKRRVQSGGRPPVPKPCPKCGDLYSGRAMRAHKQLCNKEISK